MRRWLTLFILVLALMVAAALQLAACSRLRPASQPTAALPTADPPPTPAPPQPSAATIPATTAFPIQPPALTATPTPAAPKPTRTPTLAVVTYSYPIGLPGRPPGDGFLIRTGAQTENTWYAPGNWHTGEDWYALEGDTGGAEVYAVAAGKVVYAGANYPGRVVIVAHPDGLYAMYGHLEPALAVREGEQVARGQLLGIVLTQRGARAPSHLHFELRTFLLSREINGDTPRYSYRCGVNCPPGPGYWPIDAPDLPGDRGWLNPTHAIARRMFGEAPQGPPGEVVAAGTPVSPSLTLWSGPPSDPARQPLAELTLRAGERLTLLALWTGEEAPLQTSALSYQLWYHVRLDDGRAGWVQAAVALDGDTGADGRPSSIGFNLFPAVEPQAPTSEQNRGCRSVSDRRPAPVRWCV